MNGEPTLDVNLGRTMALLRPLGIRIAVITNGSLLARPDVREDLAGADWVSLKVDAVETSLWRRIDRPHGSLQLPAILEGMLAFSRAYRGELVTETMLVKDLNDGTGAMRDAATFLARLGPSRAYLAVPTRPPAEEWVQSPDEAIVNRGYQIFREKLIHVEYLIGYEGSEFASTRDVEVDLLAITAVHPMREDAVQEFLTRGGADWSLVGSLLANRRLVMTSYEGHTFYMRRLPQPGARHSPA